MADHSHGVSRAHDGACIALLRRLRTGAEIPYVHRADVCSAAPADLVADLMPAPGTDQTEDGYNSIWYFYCPKRFKNTKGVTSGHRQRGIGAGGETRWHPEARAKDVPGSEGGTFCNCSYVYGRMKDGSLERLGWCMTEYDFVDMQAAGADTAASNYVLCKVHRPLSRAKGKSSSSSSSSKSAAASSCSKKKRKAGDGNTEARPAKLIHIQPEQEQMHHHDNTFTNDYLMLSYEQQQMDHAMFGHEEVHALQQPHAAVPENYGEFVQTEYGPMPSQLANINVDEWISYQEIFGAEEEQGLQQLPCAVPEQGGEFIQIPCGLAEATVEDMLGAETMPGECVSKRPASIPLDDDFFVGVEPKCLFGVGEEARTGASSSHAPVETETTDEDLFGPEMMSGECVSMQPAGCSRLVQEPPLWPPYLTCA